MRTVTITLFGLLLIVLPIHGDEDLERMLVPIRTFAPVPGAYGSLWSSSLLVRSSGTDAVNLHGVLTQLGVPTLVVEPAKTLLVTPASRDYQPGSILQVDRDRANELTFSLRVQDLSRQHQTWGTEVPVIRESELNGRSLVLVGIPNTSGFRTTLRIYDIRSRQEAKVRLRIFGIRPAAPPVRVPDELLAQVDLALHTPAPGNAHSTPGYLEVADIAGLLPPHDFDFFAVEIRRVTPDILPWAFVAVVNNETQHLTLITPQ